MLKKLILFLLLFLFSVYSETLENNAQYRSYSFDIQLIVKDHYGQVIDNEYLLFYSYSLPPNANEYFKNIGFIPFDDMVENITYKPIQKGQCQFTFNKVLNHSYIKMILKEDYKKILMLNKELEKNFILNIDKPYYKTRVLQDFTQIEVEYTTNMFEKKLPGGIYELRLPYIKRAHNKRFEYKLFYLKGSMISGLKLPDNIKDFALREFNAISDNGQLSNYDLVVIPTDTNRNIKVISPQNSILMASLNHDWFLIGDAPKLNDKIWDTTCTVNLEDTNTSSSVILLYSKQFDLFGKMALKKVGSTYETFITFSTEKGDRYLSQLEIDFAPKWLSHTLDSLKDTKSGKYGLVKFTPIPEWNYPVE